MFTIQARDPHTRARVGELVTPHGVVRTPAYVIVGTHAAVRAIEPSDLHRTKTQLVIANTYHLWRSLGDEGLAAFEGLHRAMQWDGPIMTDSGGFQVFSFGAMREGRSGKIARAESRGPSEPEESQVRITEDGVYFEDRGEECFIDAERSMRIQKQLGADIVVAFDECTSPHHDYAYTKEAMERTHRWAERSLAARSRGQLVLGVVQGGVFEDLRRESARVIGAMPFDGFAIGGAFGSSYGGEKYETFQELDWVMPELPEDKHRHLLGIGKIDDLFEGVTRGVDTFDCVIPTREARHGGLWTTRGRIDIQRGRYENSGELIDPGCGCTVCGDMQLPLGQLRALFKSKDPNGPRFATIHNITFFNTIMERIREAIADGTLDRLRREYAV